MVNAASFHRALHITCNDRVNLDSCSLYFPACDLKLLHPAISSAAVSTENINSKNSNEKLLSKRGSVTFNMARLQLVLQAASIKSTRGNREEISATFGPTTRCNSNSSNCSGPTWTQESKQLLKHRVCVIYRRLVMYTRCTTLQVVQLGKLTYIFCTGTGNQNIERAPCSCKKASEIVN